jgi:transcriptional regulator with XRE-family HTH domain
MLEWRIFIQRGIKMIRLKIKEIAEKRGLNMSQLARKADIDLRTLRRIYRDPTKEVSTAIVAKLAGALDVASTELIEDIP